MLGLWGFGFSDRPGSHDDDANVIIHLSSVVAAPCRVTIVGGVPEGWRPSTGASKAGYTDVYQRYAVLSPWSVRRYADGGYAGFRSGFIVPRVPDPRPESEGLRYGTDTPPCRDWGAS